MAEDKAKLMIENLNGIWKDVVIFLENNKNVSGIEPLSNFTNSICLFKFDTHYNHPKKQIFVHHTEEYQTYPRPCRPCERKISFERKDDCMVISISSKAGGGILNEKSLILKENKNGNSMGILNRLVGADTYEVYTFGISRNGNVQSRTFKKTFEGENTITKKTEQNSSTREK